MEGSGAFCGQPAVRLEKTMKELRDPGLDHPKNWQLSSGSRLEPGSPKKPWKDPRAGEPKNSQIFGRMEPNRRRRQLRTPGAEKTSKLPGRIEPDGTGPKNHEETRGLGAQKTGTVRPDRGSGGVGGKNHQGRRRAKGGKTAKNRRERKRPRKPPAAGATQKKTKAAFRRSERKNRLMSRRSFWSARERPASENEPPRDLNHRSGAAAKVS